MHKASFFRLLLVPVLICLSQLVYGQSVIDTATDGSDPYDTVNHWLYGANYLSDNVYLGRKDETVIPYYTPYFGYHIRQGITAKAMVSFTTIPKDGPTDQGTIEVDYDHSWGNFNGGGSVDKYFYDGKSQSIRAGTVASLGAYGQYGNNYLEPQLNVYWNINHASTDYAIGFQLDHNFNLAHGKLAIIPTVAMNAGTQNYYDEYYKKRVNRKDKVVLDKVVTDSKKFKPLDYEFSTVATCRLSKWLCTLTLTYAVPVNPSILTLPTKVEREKLSNSFYVQFDVCHR